MRALQRYLTVYAHVRTLYKCMFGKCLSRPSGKPLPLEGCPYMYVCIHDCKMVTIHRVLHTYSRSQERSMFRLHFHYHCNYRVHALCIYIFRCFFTLSPAAVTENMPLPCSRVGSVELRLEAGGHDVGLRSESNCPWAAARPRSVGPWMGEASYSHGSPSRRLIAFMCIRFDAIKITVLVTVRYRFRFCYCFLFRYCFHYHFTVQHKRNVDFFGLLLYMYNSFSFKHRNNLGSTCFLKIHIRSHAVKLHVLIQVHVISHFCMDMHV